MDGSTTSERHRWNRLASLGMLRSSLRDGIIFIQKNE